MPPDTKNLARNLLIRRSAHQENPKVVQQNWSMIVGWNPASNSEGRGDVSMIECLKIRIGFSARCPGSLHFLPAFSHSASVLSPTKYVSPVALGDSLSPTFIFSPWLSSSLPAKTEGGSQFPTTSPSCARLITFKPSSTRNVSCAPPLSTPWTTELFPAPPPPDKHAVHARTTLPLVPFHRHTHRYDIG